MDFISFHQRLEQFSVNILLSHLRRFVLCLRLFSNCLSAVRRHSWTMSAINDLLWTIVCFWPHDLPFADVHIRGLATRLLQCGSTDSHYPSTDFSFQLQTPIHMLIILFTITRVPVCADEIVRAVCNGTVLTNQFSTNSLPSTEVGV